uniref:Cyclin N-terminal domain-containing protein n=1 Tax=Panagrellus redivivus TaxID=6233 RepID=A0A7E4UNL3_PANRE
MAHPSFEQSMHQPSIENGITSNDLASIALKECDKIAKQLASINFRPNCEHGDILDTAEEFLQTQWRLNKFLPVQHLPLTKWFIGLRINFYALCNVTNISCKWFKGKDSHRSPIYPKRIQTLSFAILLSAVSGFREDDLLDMIDETMWKTDSTGVLFMHYLQEDPNRLWYTVLAYKKVEEMRRCSISFNTLFLILMHQLDYKHRELFVLFSLDPVMEEVFSITMKHIVEKWTGALLCTLPAEAVTRPPNTLTSAILEAKPSWT